MILALGAIHSLSINETAAAEEKWQGIDESVVKKFAKEHGREAAEPLINIEQGDLPLFLFLIAGTVGGFICGYFWRVLISQKASAINKEKDKNNGLNI